MPGEPRGHDWPGVERRSQQRRRRSPSPCRARSPACGRPTSAPGACRGAAARARRSPSPTEGLEVAWGLLLEIAAAAAEIERRSGPGGDPAARRAGCRARAPPTRPASDWSSARSRRRCGGSPTRVRGRSIDGAVAEAIVAAVAAAGGMLRAEDLAGYAAEGARRDARPLSRARLHHRQRPGRLRGARDPRRAPPLARLRARQRRALSPARRGDGPRLRRQRHLLRRPRPHREPGRRARRRRVRGAARRRDPARPSGAAAGRGRRPVAVEPGAGGRGPPAGPSAGGAHGTTQVVAADAEGNLVGADHDDRRDFGAARRRPGDRDRAQQLDGQLRPAARAARTRSRRARCRSSPCRRSSPPRRRRRAFAAAGSGGYPILAGVINTLVNVVDHGLGVQAAIDRPRVHSQGDQTYVDARVEPAGCARLAELGHELVVQQTTPGELPFSRVSAVVARRRRRWRPAAGRRGAPRRAVCERAGRRAARGAGDRSGVDPARRRHAAVRADLAAGRRRARAGAGDPRVPALPQGRRHGARGRADPPVVRGARLRGRARRHPRQRRLRRRAARRVLARRARRRARGDRLDRRAAVVHRRASG